MCVNFSNPSKTFSIIVEQQMSKAEMVFPLYLKLEPVDCVVISVTRFGINFPFGQILNLCSNFECLFSCWQFLSKINKFRQLLMSKNRSFASWSDNRFWATNFDPFLTSFDDGVELWKMYFWCENRTFWRRLTWSDDLLTSFDWFWRASTAFDGDRFEPFDGERDRLKAKAI